VRKNAIMNFEIKPLNLQAAADIPSDLLLVLLNDNFKPGKTGFSAQVAQCIKEGDLLLKAGKTLQLHRPRNSHCKRAVLLSVGEGTAAQVKSAVGAAFASLKSASGKVQNVTLCWPKVPSPAALRAAVLGLAEATYVYTTTKSKTEPRSVLRVLIAVPEVEKLKTVFDRAVATVTGIEFAKEWANRPPNHATPTMLGQAARSLSRLPKITCQVLGPKEVEKLGMGSFMAVAKGSAEPLRFIVLEYKGTAKSAPPTVLVGKGITFDTGGISIKPAAEMDEMKFDMCGAASVLGVFRALSELKPAIHVVGLIPTCENMPDGRSVKPGDVVTSMSGQTIEILNTDAEGRLILCDALTYAERFKPRAVVDIATLTGACVIALGGVRSGMFASQDALAHQLMEAGDSSMDLCWRMPLDDEYADGLKTSFADVANVGGRAAGAVTAAKFLQRFATKFPWAHLDIAGTAWKSGAAKGATGRPVGLLVDFLLSTAHEPDPQARGASKSA
jgi:leucyl aminopeptidase